MVKMDNGSFVACSFAKEVFRGERLKFWFVSTEQLRFKRLKQTTMF